MKRLGILVLAMACASTRGNNTLGASYDEPPPPPTIVQVREFPHSSIVEILAWSPEQSMYGFRAVLTRDGTLVRDHRLYVSTYYRGGVSLRWSSSQNGYASYPGFVQTADSAPRLLRSAGVARDDDACFYDWHHCSPPVTFSVRVPDQLLREKRDSIGVRLYQRGGNEIVVTLYRDVIDPYLKTVDSVATALRRKR